MDDTENAHMYAGEDYTINNRYHQRPQQKACTTYSTRKTPNNLPLHTNSLYIYKRQGKGRENAARQGSQRQGRSMQGKAR